MLSGTPPPADQPATAIQAAARLLADGEAGEAARRLEAIVQAAPAYPAAYVLLAKAYEAAERWEDALGAWHQAYFLVPGSPLVRRERQRLLDAQVRAALPAEWTAEAPEPPTPEPSAEPDESPAAEKPAEPEEPPAEPEEPPVEDPAASLAAEPGGGLPDAHQALAPDTEVEPEAAREVEPPPASAAEPEASVDADEPPVPEEPEEPEEDPLRAPEAEDVAEPFAPPEAPPEAQAHGETAEVELAPEPEAFDAYGDDEEADDLWVAPGPAVSRALDDPLDEPSIAPPDLDAGPAEPIAGTAAGEAAWWQRPDESEPEDADEEPEAGWAIVEETEAGAPPEGPVEARITAPGEEAPEPDGAAEESVEEAVEDARVVEPDDAPGDTDVADELDALIQQLEDAPRIRPDPAFSGPDVVFDEDVADDMVSETLARIYAAQHQFAEAAIVYEKLAQQKPDQAEEMLRRAAELRAQGGEDGGA